MEGRQDRFQVAQVRRRHHAGEQVHRRVLAGCRGLSQGGNQSAHGAVKPLHVGPLVAGCGDVHQCRQGFVPAPFLIGFDEHGHVVADGLRQTGGGHPDQIRAVLVADIVEGQFQVGPATEDGRILGKIGTGDVQWFLEVADHISPDISRAALRPMQQGHGIGDPFENQGRTKRRAQVAGILGGAEIFCPNGGFHGVSFSNGFGMSPRGQGQTATPGWSPRCAPRGRTGAFRQIRPGGSCVRGYGHRSRCPS